MLDNWFFPVRELNQNINGILRQLLKGRENYFQGFGESERNDCLICRGAKEVDNSQVTEPLKEEILKGDVHTIDEMTFKYIYKKG